LNPDDPTDADDDPDNDRATNLEEYLAGTDPHVTASVLKLEIISVNPTVLQFTLMPNKSYTIERRNTLLPATPWQTLISFSAQPTGQVVQVTDAEPLPARFYRIRSPRLP